MKSKKGFTLVEIIVAITIMGILLIITMPKIISLVNSNNTKKYYAYEQALERAAKTYVDSKDKELEKLEKVNDCYKIRHSILKENNLIESFQEEDVVCDNPDETFVMVQKTKNNEYKYNTSIVCYKKGQKVYENIKATGKCRTVVEPEDEPGTDEPDQEEVKTKDGICAIEVSGKKGNKGWYTGAVTAKLKTTGDVSKKGLSVNKKDLNGKTTLQQKSSIKKRTFYGYVQFKSGKTISCSKTVKVDMTKPDKPTVNTKKWTKAQFDKYKDKKKSPTSHSGMSSYSSGWSKYPIYTYPSNSKDNHSGFDHYEVKVTGASTNVNNTKATYRNIIATGSTKVSYRACDKAGNCSDYSKAKEIKVDTKAPDKPKVNAKKWTKAQFEKYEKKNKTPSSHSGMSSYSSGWYKYPVYTYPSGGSDGKDESGKDHYEVKVTGASTDVKDHKCTYRSIIASGESKVYYRSCDKAGNCSGYTSAKTIKVDTKDPSCSATKSNTGTTSGVTAKFKCSDKHSGIDTCPGGKDNKVTGIKKTTEYTVKDKAGRTDKCKVKVTTDQKKTSTCIKHESCRASDCGTEKYNCKNNCRVCKCKNEQTNKYIKVKGKVYQRECWRDKGGYLRFAGNEEFKCATTHNTNHLEETGKRYKCQCSTRYKSCESKYCKCKKYKTVTVYK